MWPVRSAIRVRTAPRYGCTSSVLSVRPAREIRPKLICGEKHSLADILKSGVACHSFSHPRRDIRNRITDHFDDFDLIIGNFVMREFGAEPWRFGAADYLSATADHRIALRGDKPVVARWDESSCMKRVWLKLL